MTPFRRTCNILCYKQHYLFNILTSTLKQSTSHFLSFKSHSIERGIRKYKNITCVPNIAWYLECSNYQKMKEKLATITFLSKLITCRIGLVKLGNIPEKLGKKEDDKTTMWRECFLGIEILQFSWFRAKPRNLFTHRVSPMCNYTHDNNSERLCVLFSCLIVQFSLKQYRIFFKNSALQFR